MSHLILSKEDRLRYKIYKAHPNLENNVLTFSLRKVLVFIYEVLCKLLPSTVTLHCVKVSVRRQINSLSPARILTSRLFCSLNLSVFGPLVPHVKLSSTRGKKKPNFLTQNTNCIRKSQL